MNFYFSNSFTRLSIAFCLALIASFNLLSILSWRLSSLLLYILNNYLLNKLMFTNKKKFDRSSYVFQSVVKNTPTQFRKTQTFRRSMRKPIFEKNKGYTDTKYTKSMSNFNESAINHIKPIVHDDFCGCEHNLQTCPKIKELMASINLNEMKKEYEKYEKISQKTSKLTLRRKYFQYLPSYYPQIYHAHLINLIINLSENLSINEFLTMAWIEYHSKLQHVTYFLYLDLKKTQISKKSFFDQLELQMIKYQINLYNLQAEANSKNIPFKEFINSYYQTNGANFIPLSQYGVFIKRLLEKGYKFLIKLLGFLFARKRSAMLEVLKYSQSANNLRQTARQLPWESYFEQLNSTK